MEVVDYYYDDDLPAISIDDSSSPAWTASEAAESAYSRCAAGCSRSIGMPSKERSCQSDPSSRLGCKAVDAHIADSEVVSEPLAPEFLVLLKGLHDQLPITLRGFISQYLDAALIAPNNDRCKVLYQEIMSDIISVVACPSNILSETDVISASAWLLCACASMRVGVSGMQALQCLLNEIATTEQILELCECIQRGGWEAAVLARGSAAAGAGLAAAVLLRAAAAAALATQVSHAAPASVEEVTAWVSAESPGDHGDHGDHDRDHRDHDRDHREHGEAWQVGAVQVAARVLANCAATQQQREALVAAFTRKCRARGPDAHKVALGISRLKLILRR